MILLIVFGTIALFEHAEFLLWTPTRTQRFLVSGGPWVVTILLLVVFGFANHRWTIRAKWLTPGWRRPKVVEIDAMGYLVIDELTQFRYAWGYFTAARETENLLILVAEDSQRHIIPKRAFVSPADLHRCKALLQGVITNTSFWAAPPTGFEMIPTPVLPLPTLPVERSKREMDGRESDPTIPSAPT
ncbi:MAG TPA: YcxB family protein [Tepidisphaeraceae bacterium]|nr:YcxB family protein [Tepidisphaeraceae bacterium]